MRPILIALSLALAAPAAAGPLQDAYNAAQAALDAGKFQEAADGFSRLLATMPKADAPGNRTAAVIRSRLGAAYLALNQPDLAIPVLERALATLPTANEVDRKERVDVQLDYAHALELTFERVRAKAAYREALAIALAANSDEHIAGARIGLGRLSIFDDPATAREQLDAAMPLVEKLLATNRDQLGDIYGMRGRVELNHGDLAAAKKWFDKGLRTAGGLGIKVSIYDTRIRSDLGIVAYLQKDRDYARKYFAFTGAGHLPDGGLTRGASTPLPSCGDATGIAPGDMVIAEFSIDADGHAIAPMTVYSSRPGAIEDQFERAISRWSWSPESLAALPPFWRNAVRLQLRCSDSGKRGTLFTSFENDFRKWARSQGLAAAPEAPSDAQKLPLLRSELTRRTSAYGQSSPQLLPVLLDLGSSSVVSPIEAKAALQQATEILTSVAAPADLRNFAELKRDLVSVDSGSDSYGRWYVRTARVTLPALQARIEARGEAQTQGSALVRTMLGTQLEGLGDRPAAEAAFKSVVAMSPADLPDGSPIRQVALLRLASIAAAKNEIAAARAALNATGLSPDQCAVADVRPVKTAGRITSDDFPAEALQWGFEGFTSIAYDIDAAGTPTNVRAVMAYPPFIFAEDMEKAVGRFRYEPLFRDGAAAGCNAMVQGINFAIPGMYKGKK